MIDELRLNLFFGPELSEINLDNNPVYVSAQNVIEAVEYSQFKDLTYMICALTSKGERSGEHTVPGYVPVFYGDRVKAISTQLALTTAGYFFV